ncbi:MAG: tRNA lysidine(34) synthetase TilS [Candidatus Bipolaricaulaceae bacterium]
MRREGLLAAGDHVVVAVSGGGDSMALLYALYWLRKELSLRLTLAHLDHGIRADTASDLAVVRQAADDLGLPLIAGRADAPGLAADQRRSLEEAARIVRRDFLEGAAREAGAGKIALGHTRTDLAETVLMHLLRGAGPEGLRGMLAFSPPYVRPLLAVSREEAREFCRLHDIPYRDDPTNLDTGILRNAIRLELLPHLARFNPRAEEAVARAARLWAEAEEALAWAAERAVSWAGRPDGLELERLRKFPRGVQALAVRAAGEAAGATLERAHVEQTLHLVDARKCGEVALPGRLRAVVDRDRLAFSPLTQERGGEPAVRRLPVPGEVELPELGWRLAARRVPRPAQLIPPTPFVAYLDPARVSPPLSVRPWRPGDRIRPLGMTGTKKVKDLLSEARVPWRDRRRWPVVCDRRGIAWVVGVRVSDDHKVDADAAEVVRVEGERR